jgi:hypothetical protein
MELATMFDAHWQGSFNRNSQACIQRPQFPGDLPAAPSIWNDPIIPSHKPRE